MEEESFRKQRQTLGIPVKLQVEISFPGRGGEFSVVMARQAFIEKDSSLSATSTCFALSASSVWASRMGGRGCRGSFMMLTSCLAGDFAANGTTCDLTA
jgi:hypothetical protein